MNHQVLLSKRQKYQKKRFQIMRICCFLKTYLLQVLKYATDVTRTPFLAISLIFTIGILASVLLVNSIIVLWFILQL